MSPKLFMIVMFLSFSNIAGAARADAEELAEVIPPPTNRQAAEKALVQALETLGIPEGNGVTALFRVTEPGESGDLFRVTAMEYLLRRGYRIKESGEFPEFRFDLDTLYVHINRKGFPRRKTAERIAEARIGAIFHDLDETRKVFRGHGIHEDGFPAVMLNQVGRDDLFPVGSDRLFGAIKPALFGLTVTGLIWLLYSYRG